MNILYPNGALLVMPAVVKAEGLANGSTVFRDGNNQELATLTICGAVVMPDDTEYTWQAPEHNPHVHDGK